jgi:heme/copper-type cytochrome/quinol oxidase subunit 2
MNRLIVVLLSVLIVLVATHGFLVWRAGEQAKDEAEAQTCLQRTQTVAIVALVAPALIVKAEEDELEDKVAAIAALGEQADDC